MREPLTMTRGDTPEWALTVVAADGSPFDLTDYEVYFTAKRLLTDADPGVFQLTVGAGVTVTDAAGGLATIQPRRGDTNTLTEDVRLFYDVQLSQEASPDQTFTVDSGTLVITRDVTRAP